MEQKAKFAFIPHKDSLFMLAQAQQAFLQKVSGTVPLYPLWAFCAEEDFSAIKNSTACTIQGYECGGKKFFFPVKVECGKKVVNLKIYFAELIEDMYTETKITCPPAGKFPIKLKSFRTGKVTLENNGWQLWGSTWITCRKQS